MSTTRYYIGINDLTNDGNIKFLDVEEGTYGMSLEEVIEAQVRSHGGLANLLQPVEGNDPSWEGYRRVTITVGPPEHYHPCTHCGEELEAYTLCEDCGGCTPCCTEGLTSGDCQGEEA
jgi:hypothetical protein